MIVGIDPSFSGTGLVICSDNGSLRYHTEKFDSKVDVYKNHGYADGAALITDHIFDVLLKVYEEHPEPIHIIAEIPALATKSGAYLAVLHGYLDSLFRTAALPIVDYIWVPCGACDSFTKNKAHSKTYLVNWVKSHHSDIPKRYSHDESTAQIFCDLYLAIKRGEYKNSYYSYVN